MPVSVSITIADPPAAPDGWSLVAFEIRAYTRDAVCEPIVMFPGTTDGFEAAAAVLIRAAETVIRERASGLRLAAVAWWVDRPLEECVDGWERRVSVYDAVTRQWEGWVPETRIGQPCAVDRRSPKWTKMRAFRQSVFTQNVVEPE